MVYIEEIAVDAGIWRKSFKVVARLSWQCVMNEVGRHAKNICLIVKKDNIYARNFYERIGIEYGETALHELGKDESGMSADIKKGGRR